MKARALAAVLLALAATGAAFGGDAEFDRIVKAIESRYGTRPVHIPFMGAANFFVKVARPEGASGFKLAVFEDLKDLQSAADTRRVARTGPLHGYAVRPQPASPGARTLAAQWGGDLHFHGPGE